MQQSLLHSEGALSLADDVGDDGVVCAWCSSRRLKLSSVLLVALGLALLLCASFVPSAIQSRLDSGVSEFVSLSPSARASGREGWRTWADWSDSDAAPVYNAVYFLNLTNSDAVLQSSVTGAKPHVQQVGPYVFREVRRKFDFLYGADPDNNRQTLSYREWVYYEYEPSMSAPGLNASTDRIVTLNVPFQAVTHGAQLGGELPFAWGMAQALCKGQYESDYARLFAARTPAQLLFGYDECIMQLAPVGGLTPAGQFPGLLGTNVLPGPNVTWELLGNATKRDMIYTGEDEPSVARQYVEWKEQAYLSGSVGSKVYPVWGSSGANRVSGTEGTMFAQKRKQGDTVVAWVEQLSRAAPLRNVVNDGGNDAVDADGADASGRVQVHGISLQRYTLDAHMLLNSSAWPANAAYYGEITGLLNVSSSKQGLPLFMSKPMFLDAAPELRQGVDGLPLPDRQLHDTMLDVEPLTGVTMRARKRLQVNLRVAPLSFEFFTSHVNWYANTTATFVPLAWIDQFGSISASKAEKFRRSVYLAQDAIKYVRLVGAIVGGSLVALAVLMLFVAARRAVQEKVGGVTTTAGIQHY